MIEGFKVSSLVSSFEESATLALAAKAKKLLSEGKPIINFGVGEPDFVTDQRLIDRGALAASKGATKYTPVSGNPSLRKAIAERISSDYGVSYSAEQVIVSAGGKQAIYHFLQSVLEPGDEVIIFSPYWVSFPEMVKLVGGKPVILKSSADPVGALTKAITSKTKALILNSPSNPSGQMWKKAELEGFLKAIESRPIWLMSDDTYYTLTYQDEPWVSPLFLRPDFRDRTCVIGSSSKTYAMTGWRLGWALGPETLIQAMTKLQSQVTSSACSLAQAAVELAVGELHQEISSQLREKFRKRRDRMIAGLSKIKGLKWLEPAGAFYIFVDFSGAVPQGMTVTQFANELLEKVHICAIPGEAFGEPSFLRFSYALSEAEIDEGLGRLERTLKG